MFWLFSIHSNTYRLSIFFIAVMTDGVIDKCNIRTATFVIHYDSAPTKKLFGKRMFCMASSYPSTKVLQFLPPFEPEVTNGHFGANTLASTLFIKHVPKYVKTISDMKDSTSLGISSIENTNSSFENTNSSFENTNSSFQNTNSSFQNKNSSFQNTNSSFQNTNSGFRIGIIFSQTILCFPPLGKRMSVADHRNGVQYSLRPQY